MENIKPTPADIKFSDKPEKTIIEIIHEKTSIRNKYNRRIDFLIDRHLGIPSTSFLKILHPNIIDHIAKEEDVIFHDDYVGQLILRRKSEFHKIYTDELTRFRQEVRACRRPTDAHTLGLYAKTATWRLAEALSLWLGGNPIHGVDLVAWAYRNRRLTHFANEICDRWVLIERAGEAGLLDNPCVPRKFIQWAVESERPCPESFSIFLAALDDSLTPSKEASRLATELEQSRLQIEQLKSELKDSDRLKNKEYQELFGALCLGIYGYNPERIRNKSSPKIWETVKYYFDRKDKGTILERIEEAIEIIEDSEKKKLVLAYLKWAEVEGDFQPSLADPAKRPRNRAKRR